jgi:2-polyprenyl-6-hydroxyphenyl methylase / 3-demethylubiquinone-9 3-methyltransferase
MGVKNTAEIDKFNALAADWWDPHGPMAPLHWMNPARLDFIATHLQKNVKSGMDVGCGAGLLTEPLARQGFTMTGMDGATDAIAVAKMRANDEGLKINYAVGEVPHATAKGPFDFVTALEIIEHVDDADEFLDAVLAPLKKGGRIFLSTLNRTIKSRVLGIYAAEYVLRALPIGTHDYSKFVKPSELVEMLEARGCKLVAMSGLVFKPLQKNFVLDAHDLDMNYILCAEKSV